MRAFLDLFREMRMRKLVYFALIANVLGTLYGWYYYKLQLAENPPYLWILITDSPNSTLFFVLALGFILKGRKNDFLSFFAASNLIKYGSWTCFVLLFHSDYFFSPYRCALYTGIFITHALMVVEAIPLVRTIDGFRFHYFLTLGWLLVNDYFDYVIGIHPYIPLKGIEVVAVVTVLLSFASFAITSLITAYNVEKK